MRPRPLYEARTSLPPAEVLERVSAALETNTGPCAGFVGRRHLNLHIHDPDRHMWSPWISIEVTENANGSELKGFFGPHPHLWGIFTAVYATQFFAFIAALMYGMVAANLGMPTWALWIAAGLTVTLTLSCAANIAGEWAGAPQMDLTKRFLADTLGLEATTAPS